MNKKGLWTAVAVVVVLLLAGGYWFANGRERTKQLEDGSKLVTAPAGKVVSGFPQELLIETAAIVQSYRLDYEGGLTQPVIVYPSAKPFAENIDTFRKLLLEKGWLVIKEDTTEPSGFLYAVKDKEELNATFVVDTTGAVEVTLAYSRR